MPAKAAPRRHALPPLRPQEEYAGRQTEGMLRRWLTRFVGSEAGMLLPGNSASAGTAKRRMPGRRAD